MAHPTRQGAIASFARPSRPFLDRPPSRSLDHYPLCDRYPLCGSNRPSVESAPRFPDFLKETGTTRPAATRVGLEPNIRGPPTLSTPYVPSVKCRSFLKKIREIHEKTAKIAEKTSLFHQPITKNPRAAPTTYCVSRKYWDSEILIGTTLSYSIQMFTSRGDSLRLFSTDQSRRVLPHQPAQPLPFHSTPAVRSLLPA